MNSLPYECTFLEKIIKDAKLFLSVHWETFYTGKYSYSCIVFTYNQAQWKSLSIHKPDERLHEQYLKDELGFLYTICQQSYSKKGRVKNPSFWNPIVQSNVYLCLLSSLAIYLTFRIGDLIHKELLYIIFRRETKKIFSP
jgi:hypothetical protein